MRGSSAPIPIIDIALIKVEADAAAAVRAARQLRFAARGRMGVRDRQPARLRAHRHGRRRQLHRPEAVRPAASTTTSRPTRPSTSATAAARSSTGAARSSASTPRSARAPATSGSRCPSTRRVAILPQLKERGRVSRGFIGVALRDVDPDLQRSLRLSTAHGALVQDVNAGSPGDRAGLRVYDLIIAVDGAPVRTNDELIRTVAARVPGTTVRAQRAARRASRARHGQAGRAPRPRTSAAPGRARAARAVVARRRRSRSASRSATSTADARQRYRAAAPSCRAWSCGASSP